MPFIDLAAVPRYERLPGVPKRLPQPLIDRNTAAAAE
ncbi:unnamed protein product [Gemmataceae bacterium]|nr:unnamed protein product [Gemmataceae bacterium]VTT99793.1 unnamed protein product [Gemmataceae bacterium]